MVVLIHAHHPQPPHGTATHATAEHIGLPASTDMTEWLQTLGASGRIFVIPVLRFTDWITNPIDHASLQSAR